MFDRTWLCTLLPLMLLTCLSGCLSLLRVQDGLTATWEQVGPQTFRYADQDWTLLFEIGTDRTFSWRVNNHTRVQLQVDQASVTLHRDGDATAYSMWGEPLDDAAPAETLVVPPGRFVSLSFPVRYASEWYPFRLTPDQAAWVEIEATWGRQPFFYRLYFPHAAN